MSGFGSGLTGQSPGAVPGSLFVSNSGATFGNATQRFAYNTSNGNLIYDAQGNTAGSSRLVVATLTGRPTLTASDLFFVS